MSDRTTDVFGLAALMLAVGAAVATLVSIHRRDLRGSSHDESDGSKSRERIEQEVR